MSSFKATIQNQKGQFLIEGILLMILSLSLLLVGIRTVRDKKVIANMIESPWNYASGMIECGIWGSAKKVCGKHPNFAKERGSTLTEFNQ